VCSRRELGRSRLDRYWLRGLSSQSITAPESSVVVGADCGDADGV
jgi:hypothetical protein